jgi:hypothetical protein
MTFFLGTKGNVRLRRGTQVQLGSVQDSIEPDDVNTRLNRLSFAKANQNILTGDRLEISTKDPRGLVCFPANTWSNNKVANGINAYVNVNAAGGLRFFRSFKDAVNNDRTKELPLVTFSGASLEIRASIRDFSYNVLGNVTSYEFNTDRTTIDTTTIDDRFKQQISAGLISGAGRIDCAFDYKTAGFTETPLLMLQLIQRLEIGSEFDLALYLTDKTIDPNVDTIFYSLTAMVTRAGVQVRASEIIDCSIDFVTTGEIQLLVTRPSSFITTESGAPIGVEQTLDALFQQDDD